MHRKPGKLMKARAKLASQLNYNMSRSYIAGMWVDLDLPLDSLCYVAQTRFVDSFLIGRYRGSKVGWYWREFGGEDVLNGYFTYVWTGHLSEGPKPPLYTETEKNTIIYKI